MKTIRRILAYGRLFRWPNLLILFGTQYLVRYAFIIPWLQNYDLLPVLSHFGFFLLATASVLISAAGYCINDYFDIKADRINKPSRMVLGRHISRRSAILAHWVLNGTGFLAGTTASWLAGKWQFSLIFLVVPFLLWLYSIRYKKKFLIGNFIVALLSAFSISMVWLFEYQALGVTDLAAQSFIAGIGTGVKLLALFAFLTTLARELIKDIEDIKGDVKIGCRTFPVIAGIRKTKFMIIFIFIAVMVSLLMFQIYLLRNDIDILFIYLMISVQLPMVFLINKTLNAFEKDDYHFISKSLKYIMVFGVMSMVVFYFYLAEGLKLT